MGHWHSFHCTSHVLQTGIYYIHLSLFTTIQSLWNGLCVKLVFQVGSVGMWRTWAQILKFTGFSKKLSFIFCLILVVFLFCFFPIKWCATCAKMNTSHPCSMHSKQTYHHLLEPVNSRVFAKYDSQRQLFDPGRVLWDCHLSACVIWTAGDSLLGLSLNYDTKTWWSSKFLMYCLSEAQRTLSI